MSNKRTSSWEQTKPLFEAWGIEPPENPERYEYGFGLERVPGLLWLGCRADNNRCWSEVPAEAEPLVQILYARPIPVPEPVTVELPPPPAEWGKVKVCLKSEMTDERIVGYWSYRESNWKGWDAVAIPADGTVVAVWEDA